MNSISFFKALLMKELDEKQLSKKQMDIADEAPPKNKITGADFKALQAKKKSMKKEGEDHEVSMANNSLESIIKSAMELKAKMGDQEKDIPAWIQDHITNAANYISQAADNYHEYNGGQTGEYDMDELPDGTVEVPAGDAEDLDMTLQSMMEDLLEAKKKPSAGLSKKQKSAIVKKAKSGKDMGKKGKGFEKIVKAAKKSGADNPEAVAGAAFWKGQAKKALKEFGPSIANVSKERFKIEDLINWFTKKQQAKELKHGLARQFRSFISRLKDSSKYENGYVPANYVYHDIRDYVAEITPTMEKSPEIWDAEEKLQNKHSRELYSAIRRELKMYDRKGNRIN